MVWTLKVVSSRRVLPRLTCFARGGHKWSHVMDASGSITYCERCGRLRTPDRHRPTSTIRPMETSDTSRLCVTNRAPTRSMTESSVLQNGPVFERIPL